MGKQSTGHYEVNYGDGNGWEQVSEERVHEVMDRHYNCVALVFEDLRAGHIVKSSAAAYRYIEEA